MPIGKPSINQPASNQLQAIQQFANNVRERFRSVESAITALQTNTTQSAATTASLLSITTQIAALTSRVAALEADVEFQQIEVALAIETGTDTTATPDASLGTSFLIDASESFTLLPISNPVLGQTYTIIVSNSLGNAFTLDANYVTVGNDQNIEADPNTYTLIQAVCTLDVGTGETIFLCDITQQLLFSNDRITEDDFTRVTEDDFTRISE